MRPCFPNLPPMNPPSVEVIPEGDKISLRMSCLSSYFFFFFFVSLCLLLVLHGHLQSWGIKRGTGVLSFIFYIA